MAWWVPRLATHGWALALALFVLGLAPLELVRHPVADASANVGVTVPMKTTIDAPTISALSIAAPTDQSRSDAAVPGAMAATSSARVATTITGSAVAASRSARRAAPGVASRSR